MTGIIALIGALIIIFGIMHPIKTIKYILLGYILVMVVYIIIRFIIYIFSLIPYF
ncbi:hypothetical protein [Staphylococcus gallinarum]|uniref:hypothetical protein n=1 Tax=Staphylococcus gallinarum TaxID=1293 RepID=UPI003F55580C